MTAAAMGASDFRELRRRERAERRDAANARAATVVDRSGVRDPLAETREDPFLRVAYVAGSIGAHVAVLALAALFGTTSAPTSRIDVPVQVRLVEAPKLATPDPAPTAAPVPTTPPPKPVVAPKIVKHDVPAPPPDTIDVPTAEPPPAETPKPARRVVGLELTSTVVGGGGPAMAVGNTRMGATSEVASDPNAVEKLAPESIPPKRIRATKPVYPPALRAQGIEGAVTVRIDVDATGRITRVTVTEPSPHEEFNRSAVEAAMQDTYEPAKVNGVPEARSIPSTVRFRLND